MTGDERVNGSNVKPKALPRKPRLFINRNAELELVEAEIDAALAVHQQSVVVLTGLPGVGKTTLAAQCAHQVEGRFPDGSLFASLGASSEAVSVEDVLFLFLTQLGVVEPPATKQGLLLAYQAATADRALLLVLDDVESAAQLVDLLPSSSRCAVLVTSRRRSAAFWRERFSVVEVPPFSVTSAVELISTDLDPSRSAAAAAEVATLAELCGRLPLALSVAGAQLSTRHRGPVADYVRLLRSARSVVEEFTEDGARLVAAVFEVSYQDLSDAERRAYRLLSHHPGRRFSVGAAVALLGPDHADPVDTLEALVVASLLTPVGDGRYEVHSLVHDHAAGLARQNDHPADGLQGLGRVVDWYLDFAVARTLAITDRPRFGDHFDGRVTVAYEGPTAWEAGVKDLESERANLRRAVEAATDDFLNDRAWQLAEALATFYFQRDLFSDAIAVHSTGLVAAQRIYEKTGDARPMLFMHTELGTAYFSAKDDEAAYGQFAAATALAETLPGDAAVLYTRAKIFQWKSFVQHRQRNTEAAVDSIGRARSALQDPLFPEEYRGRELALVDLNGCLMLSAVGKHADALAAGRNAVAFFEQGRDRHNAAKSVANLAECLTRADASFDDEAERTLRRAAGLLADLGIQSWEKHTSTLLADLLERAGRHAEARPLRERAEELRNILDSRRAQPLGDRGEDD